MEVKAKARYIRMSPKKVRLVLDVIRGMDAEKAARQLQFINKAASGPLKKLLDSAIANAENNFGLEKNNLKIKEIRADDGPTLKRWMPRAHGRATPIRKRMTHISLILEEKVPSKEVKIRKQTLEAPLSIDELAKIDKETRNKEIVTRKEKGEKRDDDGKEMKMTETGELREKHRDRKGLDELRRKEEKKGFLRRMFSRKTG